MSVLFIAIHFDIWFLFYKIIFYSLKEHKKLLKFVLYLMNMPLNVRILYNVIVDEYIFFDIK